MLSGIAILMTGSRMSLLSFGLGVFLVLFFHNKKLAVALTLSLFVVVFLFYNVLYNLGVYQISEKIKYDPFLRLTGLFFLLKNPFEAYTLSQTTAGQSLLLLPYFLHAPILGNKIFYAMGYPFIFAGGGSETDVKLMLLLADLGIVGFLVYISMYLRTLALARKEAREYFTSLVVVFLVLLLQTVTDSGLFFRLGQMIFFAFAGIVLSEHYKMSAQRAVVVPAHGNRTGDL